MPEHDIERSVPWLGTPGRTVLVSAPDEAPWNERDLLAWLERVSTPSVTCHLLHCSLHAGGPWAGIQELFGELLPHLQREAPELVERHDYELATILPRLRRSLTVRNPNLTDSSADGERVRLYPAERATRIVHGLIDLLSAWRERQEFGLWVIACVDLDHAGPLALRFFTELMRRRSRRARISLIATAQSSQVERLESQFPTGSVLTIPVQGAATEPVESSTMSLRARALEEEAGDDPIEREVQAPHIIHAWLQSDMPERALEWQAEAFAVYTKQGLYEEALEYGEPVRRVLVAYCATDDRKRVRLINKLCSCYVSSRAPEQALEVVEGGIATIQDPGLRGYIHYLLAMLHARYLPVRDLARADENLELGIAGIDVSSLDEDEKHFQKAFNRNGLALVRHLQGRSAEAIELCQGSFRMLQEHLDPERHRLHRSVLLYNIAQVYGALGDFKEAVAHYSSAMEMDPNYSEYYNERGSLYLKHGYLREAYADFQQAIELSPPYFHVWTNLGQCLRRMGRFREAVEAFSTALDLELGNSLGWVARAQSFEALGEDDLALEDYTAALVLEPDQWEVLANRAVLHFQKGCLDKALEDLNAAVRLAPGVGELYQNRATAWEAAGCFEQARSDLYRYLSLQPEAGDRSEIEIRLERLAQPTTDIDVRA